MIEKRLRCGVLGAGWWSTFAHIPALQNHPLVELLAVQKRDRAAAEKVAADFHVPHACTSLEEMLKIGLDAVVIGTTPNVHHAQAKLALESGLHVLLEKPMTLHAPEAEELVALASEKGLQLLVSCPWHYTRHGREAQRLGRAGELGRIRMISILMTNFVEDFIRGTSTADTHSGESYTEPHKSSYCDPAVAGGGQIYTQVSHTAAYLTYLTGAAPKSVYARFENAGAEMDLFDALTVEMSNGTLVSMASVGAPMRSRRSYEVRIFGDDGMLYLELWDGLMQLHLRPDRVVDFPPLTKEEIYPHEAPARNFIDCIVGRESNLSPGELGLAAAQIIDAACQSADSGHPVGCDFQKPE